METVDISKEKARLRRSLRRSIYEPDKMSLKLDEWITIREAYNCVCAYCGEYNQELTLDHVKPLSKGGTHTADNVVPCCKSCNSKKGTKDTPSGFTQIFIDDIIPGYTERMKRYREAIAYRVKANIDDEPLRILHERIIEDKDKWAKYLNERIDTLQSRIKEQDQLLAGRHSIIMQYMDYVVYLENLIKPKIENLSKLDIENLTKPLVQAEVKRPWWKLW